MNALTAGQTILVKGEGGHQFAVDVPADGTNQREIFDDALAKGRLAIIGACVVEQSTNKDGTPGPEFTTKLTGDPVAYVTDEGVDADLGPPPPGVDPAPDEVPDGTIEEVLVWVDADPGRAQVALEAEQAGKQRRTLLAALGDVIGD
jgi:hypothetical protein